MPGEYLDNNGIGLLNDRDLPRCIDKRVGTSSCLDLCFVSLDLMRVTSFERCTGLGSDHFPIKCTF